MNGFEPLRRRIVDYTIAGQWSETYDGPLEECEEYKVKAENDRLRKLVVKMFGCVQVVCNECWSGVTDVRECDNDNCACTRIYDIMLELGIEV